MTISNKLTRKIKTLLFIVAPHVPSSESTRNTIPLANITYSAVLVVWTFFNLKSINMNLVLMKYLIKSI